MRARVTVLLFALTVPFAPPTAAQDLTEDILRAQVEQVLHGMIGQTIDRQLKVVDIGQGDGRVRGLRDVIGLGHSADIRRDDQRDRAFK